MAPDAPPPGGRGEAPRTGPNGERLVRCKACGALMYWRLNPATGNRVPIALATGESHFRDCYAARSFSRKRG
jgi:hypothetical protein